MFSFTQWWQSTYCMYRVNKSTQSEAVCAIQTSVEVSRLLLLLGVHVYAPADCLVQVLVTYRL